MSKGILGFLFLFTGCSLDSVIGVSPAKQRATPVGCDAALIGTVPDPAAGDGSRWYPGVELGIEMCP